MNFTHQHQFTVNYCYVFSFHTDTAAVQLDWEESEGEEDVAEESIEYAVDDVPFRDTSQPSPSDDAVTTPRRKLPGPADISQSSVEDPQQPHLLAFPQTMFGERKRSFNKEWYDTYSWIEYSVERDAVFCFACRHFPTPNKPTEQSFTQDGFKNWRHAMGKEGKLVKHERSHKAAMETWAEFKLREKSNTNIGNLLNEGHNKLVKENRHYVKAIVKVLRMTATQKIAQRGHREGPSSMNRGNFLATLHLISEYDKIVEAKLSGPRNAKYTHPAIQNEILHIMADTVRDAIRSDIEPAGFFSLQVDETKDISKKEIVSFVVRYFHNGEICEEFLHFREASGLDAESLFKLIQKTLNDSKIDIQKCVGQCYDGASVMSGANAGVQAKFRELVPQAIYTHCFAHRLNLALVDSLKNVDLASEFFAVLQKLYVYLSGSFTHQVFLQAQKDHMKDKRPVELKRLSDTRWACQHAACVAISEALPAITVALEELAGGSNKDRAVDARGLLAVINGSFVVGLVVLRSVLRKTKTLSDQLQARDLDLAEAVYLVEAVVADLVECRSSEDAWNTLFEEAEVKCRENDISLDKPSRPKRKRSLPAHLGEAVVMGPTGNRDQLSTSDEFKVNFFYPILDALLAELRSRFAVDTCGIIRGTSALNPKNKTFLQEAVLHGMASHYGCVEEDLKCELHQTKKLLERKMAAGVTVESIIDFANLMLPYRDAFFEMYKLICISLTLSVSSAGCERSFSCLKLQKNYLRSTSGEERTSDLGVLAINSGRTASLDLDEIVNRFAHSHGNRRLTLI